MTTAGWMPGRRDPTRTEKLRIAARVLLRYGAAGNGARNGCQARLAEHFGVTRQRVSQIVREELELGAQRRARRAEPD